jgi:murein DD-endopeptidase MepM/ murein hydrolase activator NlpD
VRRIAPVIALIAALVFAPAPAFAAGDWTWPVVGPLGRPYDPPASPYGTGHRGIDILAPTDSVAVAPEAGVVSFAGRVGGRWFVTIDHGGGLESTMSWVNATLVRRGDVVAEADPVALTGTCHPGDTSPCLHFGVRLHDAYQDPLDYLGPIEVWRFIRLAPFP